MTTFAPPLASLMFEPYVSVFSVATAVGAVVGAAVGAASARMKVSAWLKGGLAAVALGLSFVAALAAQSLLRIGGASWALFGQASVGVLFGWGLYAMIGTYLRIFERSGRRLAWGLLALRLAGILLLVVILANPVWKHQEVDPGRIVVVLDDSRSMSLADPNGGTRYDHAKAALDKFKHTLESEPNGPHLAVDLYDINGARLDDVPAAATVNQTDLTHALQEAVLKSRGGHLVAGAVLISDGMDTTGRPDFRGWEDESISIYGLGFPANSAGDLDLAVTATDAPKRALIHNELSVKATIGKAGTAAADAVVSLKLGTVELASQKVHFDAGEAKKVVPLTFTPDQAGDFVFTAAVGTAASEVYLGNNAAQVPMRIDSDPIRVLYVEGYLRFESKYLKERFLDDPDVALAFEIRRDNPDADAGRKEFLTEANLKQADVVILGDMEGKYLSAAEYQRLKQWLDEKNHSLLVLGGYRSFGPDGFRDTPLADVLPVVFAAGSSAQLEEPVRLRLTDRGQGHAIFTLSGDRVKDAETWADMPPLPGMCLVQRVKPGAEELAVNPAESVDGKPAVVAAAQNAPGGGRVLVLTIDSTWQWSRLPRVFGQADTPYNRFWSQTVRWLAGKGNEDNRPLLTASTDRPFYDIGQRVQIRLARQSRPDLDVSQTKAALEIIGPDGKPLPPDQTPTPAAGSARPDVFTAEFTPAAAGRYQVNAALTADGNVVANQTAEFRAQGADYELADPRTNPGALEALAKATGGLSFDVDRADELAKKIQRKDRIGPEQRDEFWNSPLLFAAFLACVSMEWFLRRWNQMV
jgi:uncharacterized membrane protein